MKRLALFLVACFFFSFVQSQNYPNRSDVLWVTTPDHSDWLYELNEEAKVTLALYHYGIPADGVEVSYQVGPELMPADMSGTVTLENGEAILSMGTMTEPGFRDMWLSVEFDGRKFRHHVKVGFEPEKLNTLRYFDVVNFARLIDVPVFMTWGYNDNVCPPTTSYIVYNLLDTEKEALITPINEHWVSTNTRHVILDWIGEQLR